MLSLHLIAFLGILSLSTLFYKDVHAWSTNDYGSMLFRAPNHLNFLLSNQSKKKFRLAQKQKLRASTEAINEIDDGKIKVRFVNTITGKDVITFANRGDNLLAVGDNAGVQLPRACRTGLCGSCTCELKDPAAIVTKTNPREGFATIRACSTKCFIPEGETEMIIDVNRMRGKSKKPRTDAIGSIPTDDDDDYSDPMTRFSGDWEKEFRPLWEAKKLQEKKLERITGVKADPKNNLKTCLTCGGLGRMTCYNCNGSRKQKIGVIRSDEIRIIQCGICMGQGNVGCADCRGQGTFKKSI